MNDETLTAIRQHAAREYPRECCGLVIVERGKERYVECTNAAQTPSEHFVLPAAEYAAAEGRGEVLAVVHSHPDCPAAPSAADRVACEASGLPWLILSWPADLSVTIRPEGYVAPLVGRPFAHGVLDCYALIRDWYARAMDVSLPDFDRRDGWWNAGQDLYMQHFGEAGFRRLTDDELLEPGDVVLMQVRAPVANHAGVYLGDGVLLHHRHGRLSTRDVYGGYWLEKTVARLRHGEANATKE